MLKTEMRNEASKHIDRMDTLSMVQLISEENMNAVRAVEAASEQIAAVCDAVADCFEQGGRLFYIGAGTSSTYYWVFKSACMTPSAQATGSTSGILKAVDPYAMVEEMLYNLRKAWDELHI